MLNLSNYFTNKEQKKEFFIAICVIVLFGIFLIYLMPSLGLNEGISKPHRLVTTEEINYVNLKNKIDECNALTIWVEDLEKNNVRNTNHFFTIKKDTTLSKKDTIIEELIIVDNIPKSITDSLGHLDNINNNLIKDTLEKVTKIEEEDIKLDAVTESIKEEVIVKKEAIVEKEMLPIDEKPIHKKSEESTYNTQGSCVIILGAFSDKANLKALQGKIEKDVDKKYIYLGKRKKYDVIGVYVDCQNYQDKLNTYKTQYTERAWLLKLN